MSYGQMESNIWVFGYNGKGELGLGRTAPPQQIHIKDVVQSTQLGNFKAKQISCGEYHMGLIDFENNVWIWGDNEFGQLGLEGESRNIPTLIPSLKAKQISLGGYHTVLIDLNDNVWIFGRNDKGQLGLGDKENRNILTQLGEIKAVQISAGNRHTLIIDQDKNIWGFGENECGELGIGNYEDTNVPTLVKDLKAKEVSAGGNHSLVIDLEDNVWGFGSNYFGQSGLGHDFRKTSRNIPTQIPNLKAKQVSAGEVHSMVLDLDNNVWVFGSNFNGRLGINSTNMNEYSPVQISNMKAKSIHASNSSAIIDLEDNLYLCGDNKYGGLGLSKLDYISIYTLFPGFKVSHFHNSILHGIIIATKFTY